MSQTGYLLTAFAAVVAVLAGWIAIMAAKLARIRREDLEHGGRGDG